MRRPGKGFFGEHYTVPLVYNDFIFAYIAESAGFVGALLVLGLLLGLALRRLPFNVGCFAALAEA